MLDCTYIYKKHLLTLLLPDTKIAEFTNSVDFDEDEVAHHETPHPDLHCLSSSLLIFNMT